MKVSVNWIRHINSKYQCSADPMPDGIDALVEKIGAQLGAVEEVIDIGKKYQGVVVAKVVECQKHPNADKLSICLVDDGKAVKDVKRDDKGLVEVVCGAPNVAVGQLVAWMPPGSTVPSTVDKEPFALEAREIRGKLSNGMIASAKELALGDEHEGILVIDEPAKPGQPFAEVYQLDDYIIDIENKMFTHRPDLFGLLGIARELAGIQSKSFKSPDWYRPNAKLTVDGRKHVLNLRVKNEIPRLVPRFCAVVIKDIKVGPGPIWLQTYLVRVGIKPVNNIVDLTNFFMYETGQPLHAYDYDRLKTGVLGVRLPKKGEKVKLLGGKTVKLESGTAVITDGNNPIGLGGVMGGADTEVGKDTKNIVIESANFDTNITRLAAMAYGLFTEAAIRFTKNQSPLQCLPVLVKIVENVLRPKYSGGRVASRLIDNKHFNESAITIGTSADFVNSRLGLQLTAGQMKKILENIEFEVKASGDKLDITAPFWRTDIAIPEDIVEEIGRLYGYDHLPLELPKKDLTPAPRNEGLDLKNQIRQILSAAGANEVLTYSFVHSSLIEKAGQDVKDAYHIRNALSPDLQYYRLDLIPSLLEKIHPNIKEGFDKFVLFEIGRAHIKGVLDKEKLPKELDRLAFVGCKNKASKEEGSPYFAAKKQLENLLHDAGIHSMVYEPLGKELPKQWQIAATTYEPKRSAVIYLNYRKKEIIGLIGEPSQALKRSLKLPSFISGAELDLEVLIKNSRPPDYYPLNKFPAIEQDICLRTDANLSYGELTDFVLGSLGKIADEHNYFHWLSPVDIYQKPEHKSYKQTTWHISLSHSERTLTTTESNKVLDKIAAEVKKKFNAERI